MIKNIIIPEKIGSYYLFSKQIVGIDIGKTEIHAAICYVNGNKRTIVNLIEEKIENNNEFSHEQRVINALKNLKTKLGNYDAIYTSFSSSSVIFKELQIPFLGLKKIKMVVPYEVENLLPFSLNTAELDCIITKEDKKNQITDVLVAAAKKEHIDQFLHLFQEAGINVEKVTVDMFEFYSFYQSIPSYRSLNGIISLIDIELFSIRLAVIIDDQLKYIRVIPKGIATIAKKLASTLSIESNEALNQLLRFGLTNSNTEEYEATMKNSLAELIHDIEFTITSYTTKIKSSDQLKRIILTGKSADIPGIKNFVQETTKIPTEILETKKIMHNNTIKSKITPLPNSFILSIITSLALPTTQEFNLYQEHAQKTIDEQINKQIIALCILLFTIFSSFAVFSYLKINSIKTTAINAESSAIEELKKTLKLKGDIKTLEDANKKANKELYEQENAWQQLALKNRFSFLNYLAELSKCINPKEVQLELTALTIKENTIKLYGSVPDYQQLRILDKQLKCPLLSNMNKLKNINFKAEPIVLTIKSNEEF